VAVSSIANANAGLADRHGGRRGGRPSNIVLAVALLFALGSAAACAETIGGALSKAYKGGNQTSAFRAS
jgi:hypothetical protein